MKYNDPIYVKMEKLDVMIRLAQQSNIAQVLSELKELVSFDSVVAEPIAIIVIEWHSYDCEFTDQKGHMETVKLKSPLQICHRGGRRFRAQVSESHRTMRHQG